MKNLLDVRVDHTKSMDWTYGHTVVRTLFHGPAIRWYRQYHQLIDSPEHLGCNRSIAAHSVRGDIAKNYHPTGGSIRPPKSPL
jgi:hypothetical protein